MPSNHAKKQFLCSLYSRQQGEDPIGSARTVRQFLFVEVPKPWHSSALKTEHFPESLSEAYKNANKQGSFDGKFLFVAPDPDYSEENYVRFLYFEQPAGPFAVYKKDAFVVPEDRAIETGQLLLMEPEQRYSMDEFREDSDDVRELLVCTHRERDPCCGAFGPAIHEALRTHYANEKLRTWQVSHIGGHRLCPNVVDLPEGRYWGRLHLDVLDNFVYRDNDFSTLSSLYRGWCALEGPAQILERKAFEETGWDWIDYDKKGIVKNEGSSGDQWEVKITYESDTGQKGEYRGIVKENKNLRRLANPCGEPVEEQMEKPIVQYNLLEYNHTQRG